MNTQPSRLLVTNQDFERLTLLVGQSESDCADQLDEELSRATVLPQEEIPPDVVTMNSRVKFVDLESGKDSEVALCYPRSADLDAGKISILTPVGVALIGLRVGATITWPMPNGKTRSLKVLEVAYQPEAAGDWEL